MVKPAVLVGMAVGDALGMPFEKLNGIVHPDLSGWDGKYKPGTWHKLPAGHWTDDTEMAVCLAESLIARMTYDLDDVAKRYCAWAQGTPHGMGGTTKTAMRLLSEGFNPTETGQPFEHADKVGSGTAMRIAPLGLFCRSTPYSLNAWAPMDARITHVHDEATAASLAVSHGVRLAVMKGMDDPVTWLTEISKFVAAQVDPSKVGERIFHAASCLKSGLHPEALVELGIAGRHGNAWQITVSALYCAAFHWTDYQTAVFQAVSLGGDCDTRGAITGGIMGARCGLDKIPVYLRDGLYEFNKLAALDEALTEASG